MKISVPLDDVFRSELLVLVVHRVKSPRAEIGVVGRMRDDLDVVRERRFQVLKIPLELVSLDLLETVLRFRDRDFFRARVEIIHRDLSFPDRAFPGRGRRERITKIRFARMSVVRDGTLGRGIGRAITNQYLPRLPLRERNGRFFPEPRRRP